MVCSRLRKQQNDKEAFQKLHKIQTEFEQAAQLVDLIVSCAVPSLKTIALTGILTLCERSQRALYLLLRR